MNKKLLVLRVLETIFLVGLVGTIHPTVSGFDYFIKLLSISFNFSITLRANSVIFSSVLVGYIFSFFATYLQRVTDKRHLRKFSFILSLIGIVSYGNELARYYVGYNFQLMLDFPIVLLVVDWLLFKSKSTTA